MEDHGWVTKGRKQQRSSTSAIASELDPHGVAEQEAVLRRLDAAVGQLHATLLPNTLLMVYTGQVSTRFQGIRGFGIGLCQNVPFHGMHAWNKGKNSFLARLLFRDEIMACCSFSFQHIKQLAFVKHTRWACNKGPQHCIICVHKPCNAPHILC